jgi:excisionase family DNA binding protein
VVLGVLYGGDVQKQEKIGAQQNVLLKVDEAAQLLRLSPGTVYHMASQGRIPGAVRLSNRCLRFLRHELLRWVSEQADRAGR